MGAKGRFSVMGALAVAWAVVATGCIGDPATDATFGRARNEGPPPPVLVGMIDFEINPYRPEFIASVASSDVANHLADLTGPDGRPPLLVQLASEGTVEERATADEAFWKAVEPGRLYAFAGTRVMAVTVSDPEVAYIYGSASPGHGTLTSSLVARESPDAIIVMAVAYGDYCFQRPEVDCYVDPRVASAMSWLSSQPAIDVISVSLAPMLNEPNAGPLHAESTKYRAASRAAAARGAVIVNGAGNYLAPPLTSYFGGPPWVISVGGLEPGPRGESVFASKLPDVVANFTERFAAATENDTEWHSGTSFATPIVAGTLARALGEIRTALGHEGGITEDGALAVGRTRDGRELRVTSETLRDALNASALTVAPTEWDPTNASAPFDPLLFWTRTSVPVVAPPVQTGWGYVHAGLASEIARRVLEEDTTPPEGKEATAAWMSAVQAAREAYWDRWPE